MFSGQVPSSPLPPLCTNTLPSTGYTSALVQAIPTNMTMFAVYNLTKSYAHDRGLMTTPVADMSVRLLCSVLGTYSAIMVTAPIDIARTYREAMASEMASVPAVAVAPSVGITSGPLPSTWRVMKDIYHKHGLQRMYAGANARLLSSTPYTVAMLVGYDYVRLFAAADVCE